MASSMARLALKSSQHLIRVNKLLTSSTRSCGWVRDWKPGPPPTTPEERAAAARKYNLIPEDYESYDASEAMGDYPKLPPVGMDARDPYEDMDYYFWRSNYGEPLHRDYDMFTADRHDPNAKWRLKGWQMVASFLGFVGFFFTIFYLEHIYDFRVCQPMKPKQFPGPGKIHYTFEPEYD